MEKDYAQALYDAAHEEGAEPRVLVRNLVAALKVNGHEKMLSGIFREMERIEARHEKLAPLVEVAHQKDAAEALKAAAAQGIHATKVHVNHSLIQGWRATGNGKLIDSSGKRALIELYRNITTHS